MCLLVLFCMAPPMPPELFAVFSVFSTFRSFASTHAFGGCFHVFHVFGVLESRLAQYNVTLRRVEKDHWVCLRADAIRWKHAAAATVMHSRVQLIAVQGLLACGVKNTQSTVAARAHLDKVYWTFGAWGATNRILKSVSICTACEDALRDLPLPCRRQRACPSPKAFHWRL